MWIFSQWKENSYYLVKTGIPFFMNYVKFQIIWNAVIFEMIKMFVMNIKDPF